MADIYTCPRCQMKHDGYNGYYCNSCRYIKHQEKRRKNKTQSNKQK